MVGESKKMKISISLTNGDYEFLNELKNNGTVDSISQAIRYCIKIAKNKEKGRN